MRCGFHRCKRSTSSLEDALSEPGRLSPPIWPCTTRGFPCLRCHHRSGGLLPHLFTLAKPSQLFEDASQVSLFDVTELHSAGGLFSVALSVTPCSGDFTSPLQLRPLALPGALPMLRVPLTIPRTPFGVRKRPASQRCPDFPPALALQRRLYAATPSASAGDHPAHPPPLLYPVQSAVRTQFL